MISVLALCATKLLGLQVPRARNRVLPQTQSSCIGEAALMSVVDPAFDWSQVGPNASAEALRQVRAQLLRSWELCGRRQTLRC